MNISFYDDVINASIGTNTHEPVDAIMSMVFKTRNQAALIRFKRGTGRYSLASLARQACTVVG